ncbi:MAG: UDP-glucose dehydrogenase family protein [Bacillota bacterium]
MRISVIGTGYVGLVSGVCLAAKGHDVIAVDKRREVINRINRTETPIYEPGLDGLLKQTLQNGKLIADCDLRTAVMNSDISLITVGTPCKGGKIDLSYLEAAAREIGRLLTYKESYHVVCVKSTVVPTTTDTLVKNTLESVSGKKIADFGLAMNPEFLREGKAVEDFMHPDRIVIGAYDARSFETMRKVYDGLFDAPILGVNLRTAEMIKYASNILLADLISYSNEIASVCEQMGGVDVTEVLEGVSLDKRFSPKVDGRLIRPEMNKYLRAGCGFGGSCFPKDVKALVAFAREKGYVPRLMQSVMEINEAQPVRLINRLERALGDLSGKKIALLGVAFKPDTDDVRESPALVMIKYLLEKNAVVYAADPVALENAKQVLPGEYGRLVFTEDYKAVLQDAEAAILVTAWPQFMRLEPDECRKLMKLPLIVDGRRVYQRNTWEDAGFKYLGVGLSEYNNTGGKEGG